MIAKPTPVLAEIQRAVEVIVGEGRGRVVEVRALNTPEKTYSGYYNNGLLAQDVFDLSSIETTPNIYWTIQEINPDLMKPGQENTIRGRVDKTTNDTEVRRYLWLPIDCDPVRPAGTSSTEAEKALALEVALKVQEFLRTQSIDSILADSGNGYHVLVPLDIPNQNGANKLIETVLKTLKARFGTATVDIDTSVFNPSRILKVYGSVARKGSHTDERPWRLSRLIDVPSSLTPLSEEQLRLLSDEIAKELAPEKAVEINERKKYEPPVKGTQITTERNNAVCDYAWYEWNRQTCELPDVEDLKTKVYQFNSEFCSPPLEESELDRTVLSSTPKKRRAKDNEVKVGGKVAGSPSVSAEPETTETVKPSTGGISKDPKEAERLLAEAGVKDYKHLLTVDLKDGKLPWILTNVQKPSQVPDKNTEWILDQMIMVGGLHVFSSLPGGEKSVLSLLLTKTIATAGGLFGRKNGGKPITVVVLDRENPPSVVYERLYGLGLTNLENVRVWGEWDEVAGPVPTAFDDPRLIECARRMGSSVLFIGDSLSSFSEGVDENSVKEMNPIMRKALKLARMCGGFILLHHTDKGGNWGRGTVAIRANSDMAFLMDKRGEVVTISAERFRPCPEWTLKYKMDWGGLTGIFTPHLISDSLAPGSAPPSQDSIEDLKRRERQATEEATRNHYIQKAKSEIEKAYKEAVAGTGDPISNRNQLATLIGLNPTGRQARCLLNGNESNPWECVKGDRNTIIYLPTGVKEIPPRGGLKKVEADKMFAEGKTVDEVTAASGMPNGTVRRWRTEWGKEHE
jgi:hypothetical protein